MKRRRYHTVDFALKRIKMRDKMPSVKNVRSFFVDKLPWFRRRFVINISLTSLIVISLVVVALLPLVTVRASTTLNWSTNADFALNKAGKCQATIQSNVVISGDAYTDPTCAASDADANMTLAPDIYQVSDVVSSAGSQYDTVVVKSDGTVWTWGKNTNGQLGDGTTTDETAPTQVKSPDGTGFLTNVKSVAVRGNFTIALKNDGTVWAWGDNTYGQLGDNTNTTRSLPTQVKSPDGTGFLTNVKSVAAGYGHAVALLNDGTVWAWGYNGYGQLGDYSATNRSLPVQVVGPGGSGFMSNVTAIAAGDYHTVFLESDGTVFVVGNNNDGEVGNNSEATQIIPLQTKSPDGTGFLTGVSSIAAGSANTVAIKSDGSVFAWGYNGYGEIGDGTTITKILPTQVRSPDGTGYFTGASAISAGAYYVEALKTDGTVWAWGDNGYGQLGDNTYTNRALPIQVKNSDGTGFLADITIIATGRYHALAVDANKSLLVWGNNNENEHGPQIPGVSTILPNYVIAKTYSTNLTDVKQVASAGLSNIAVKNDGTVWAWGYNGNGQLGDGTTTNRDTAVQVRSPDGTGFLTDVKAVAEGGSFSMALKNDGTVWTWGNNGNGQLGDNTYYSYDLPTQVTNTDGTGFLTDVTSISAGGYHGLALKTDGTVWAWGSETYGQLGDGGGSYKITPVQVESPDGTGFLTGVSSIATGTYNSSAVKSDGTVWAWGYNGNGQLGDGTTNSESLPVQTKSPDGTGFLTGVRSVTAGGSHVTAIKTDGTVFAWGDNSSGQLGDGTNTNRSLPVQTKSPDGTGFLTNVASVGVGLNHVLAIKTDGTVFAWGYNGYGEIGDGTFYEQTLPTQVVGVGGAGYMSDAVSASAGDYHSVIAKTDGTVFAWGYDNGSSTGIDGYGNESNSITPRQIFSNFQLKAGYSHSGTVSGFIVDAGVGRKYQWNAINWDSAALPVNTSISFNARTSNDGIAWSAWSSNSTQSTTGSTTGSGDFSGLPLARFIEIQTTLASSDQVATPTLNDFALTYVNDSTAPTTNANGLIMQKAQNGAIVSDGAWTNAQTPYFSWTGGADNTGGVGLLGYCLYLGQDSSANVQTTKGMLGTSPVATDGACQYIVSGTNLDTATSALATSLTTSDQPYYLLIKAIDKAGNLYDTAASLSFRFDNTPPTTPAFISAPSQFISTKDATLTWPTTGGQAAADADSGLAGLQYKIGTSGTWYGDSHTGAQDVTDVLANDGSYTTDPTVDYPLLNEGNNIIYFRAIDNAGNVSTTNNTAAIKINTTSPTSSQNLVATPATNTSNAFAFSWDAPATFVGPSSAVTYCYTVNTLPSSSTCSFTPAGQTSLATDAYATQPGSNTLYVVAKDEAGNINYDTYATVTFNANTPAPGIPLNAEIADISTKATSTWKLALSWSAPTDVGAGVSKYAISRSTDGTNFTQVATTSGLSYVDSALSQQVYYYKIHACDSANNCGADSDVFSLTPTGRFTSPPELVTSPSVSVSTQQATFTYVTDRVSDSRIQYGTTSGVYFPGEIDVSSLTKNHVVEISNLNAGTTYFYKAKWTDEDGNTGISTELSFTTLPAPSIKNVSVLNTTLDGATIQFTSQDASQVLIYYGKTENYGGVKTVNTSRSESTYNVDLDGLDDGSTYFYKFVTVDSDANQYDSHRADSFTTPERPRISNLQFQPVNDEPTSTQKVTWTTNVLTDSTVSYSKLGDAAKDIYDATMTTDHAVIISGLEDASEYTLLAQSRDANGNLATSDSQSFRTALDTRPPKISNIQVESSVKGNGSEARGQLVVSWDTDEPATSQVAFAQGSSGANYSSKTAEDTRLTEQHVVIVSDLAVSSVYHVQPISLDASSNMAYGNDTSAIIGRATDSVLNIILSTLNKIFGL